MSNPSSQPERDVMTLSDDEEMAAAAVVPPDTTPQAITFPSQSDPIVLSDDDEPHDVPPTPRKLAKRPGADLEGSSSSQSKPFSAVGESSEQFSFATPRKSAKLQGQSSSSARADMSASSASSSLTRIMGTPEQDEPLERNEEPSTSSTIATRRSTLGSARKRLNSLRILNSPVNEPAASTPQRSSSRLQEEEPMEVDDSKIAAVPAKKEPNVRDIVADVDVSTPQSAERRQSARLRARAPVMETPTKEQVRRDPTPVSTRKSTRASKSNSDKVKIEQPAETQRASEGSSATKASTSSMARPPLRSIKKEVDEVMASLQASPSKAQGSSENQTPVVEEEEEEPRVFYLPRPLTVPHGLIRVPYHVDLSEEQKEALQLLRIQVEELDNFPAALELSQPYIRNENDAEVKAVVVYGGEHALASLPDYIGQVDDNYVGDKEERIWSAANVEASLRENEPRLNQFYQAVQDEYFFCIWRQFEGRIPKEVALQHLMSNGQSIEKSLETIEKCLEKVPQKLRHLSTAQAYQLYRVFWTQHVDDYNYRTIQETILKNFHLSEVVTIFHRFKKFYGFDDDSKEILPACNCSAGLQNHVCREVTFQPRFACANCTKNVRKTNFPPTGLCLICMTYEKLAQEARPVENIVFDDDDYDKMAKWDEMEAKSKRRVNLSQFEKRYEAEQDKKHLALRVTKEESLTLNYEKLKGGRGLPRELKLQLTPFVLPHFPKCRCEGSGWIPVRSANYDKITFSDEEVEAYRTTILANPGNVKAVANQLGVEIQLVERFISAFPHDDPIWEDQLEEEILVEPRVCRPFDNFPPFLELSDEDQAPRQMTPPIPLGEDPLE